MEKTKHIEVMVLLADTEEIYIANDFEPSLEAMQKIVGGYIEAVRVSDSIVMWLDEEGKFKDYQPNFNLIRNGDKVDVVMGNVLFTGTNEEGETVGLTEEEKKEISSRFMNRRNFRL